LTLNRFSLAALSDSIALAIMNRDLPRMDKKQTSPEKPNYSGLDLEKVPCLPVEAEVFS